MVSLEMIYTRPLKNWDIVSEEFRRGECSRQMGTRVVECFNVFKKQRNPCDLNLVAQIRRKEGQYRAGVV